MNRGALCVGGPAHGRRFPARGAVLLVPIAVDTGHGWGPFIIEARYDLAGIEGDRRMFWRWRMFPRWDRGSFRKPGAVYSPRPPGEPTDRSPTR